MFTSVVCAKNEYQTSSRAFAVFPLHVSASKLVPAAPKTVPSIALAMDALFFPVSSRIEIAPLQKSLGGGSLVKVVMEGVWYQILKSPDPQSDLINTI